MASDSESKASPRQASQDESRGGMLKLGVVAVASALLGGVAAAWWYRKTLHKLHESGESSNNPHFGIDDELLPGETREDS
jgi:hypothetical protein